MSTPLPLIICLMGPTASGKTHLAIELVQRFPCDIISVDSAMVYRGLDIGTAKPTLAEQKLAPHRLLDICDPKEIYSAGRFRQEAMAEIDKIIQRGRTPLLVGGTMLYFHVLQKGLAELPQADSSLRKKIAAQAQEEGWSVLYQRLIKMDPLLKTYIHENDKQRIARALEIQALTNKKPSEIFSEQTTFPLPYRILNLVVATAERERLHEKITKRFYQMLEKGFIAEVEALFRRGDLNTELPAIRSVGYRQVWSYLAGELNYDAMQERSLIATRQLAKRQMTWLRSWQSAHWFDSADSQLLEKIFCLLSQQGI